jgi:hypothetical protein
MTCATRDSVCATNPVLIAYLQRALVRAEACLYVEVLSTFDFVAPTNQGKKMIRSIAMCALVVALTSFSTSSEAMRGLPACNANNAGQIYTQFVNQGNGRSSTYEYQCNGSSWVLIGGQVCQSQPSGGPRCLTL